MMFAMAAVIAMAALQLNIQKPRVTSGHRVFSDFALA